MVFDVIILTLTTKFGSTIGYQNIIHENKVIILLFI
jgi:hypothetical protein